MAADVVDKMYGVQEILAIAYGYVDCITWTQGEDTCYPCCNADSSSFTTERDVGAACMFQQFLHNSLLFKGVKR